MVINRESSTQWEAQMPYKTKVTDQALLGAVLQQARMTAGISQRELADRVGTSQRYIWELEAGKESPLLKHLFGALEAVGASVYVEFGEGDNG